MGSPLLRFAASSLGVAFAAARALADPSPAYLLKNINVSSDEVDAAAQAGTIARAGGLIFFTGRLGESGSELWKSDGTSAGTVQVKDIQPGSASSNPRSLTDVNGT